MSQHVTTDASGFYSFAGLRPGNYTITETSPSGWIDGKDTIGLYRPQNGDFILGSGCDQEPEIEFLFGNGGPALPLAGDWNGDGHDSVGLYDPRNSAFVLSNGLAGGAADHVFRLRPRIRNAVPLSGHW